MYIKISGIKIHITFLFAVFIAFAVNSGKGEMLLTVFVSGLLHECAHLCFLLSYGAKEIALELSPGGAKIKGGGFDTLPYNKSLVCVLAGPCINIMLAAALFAFSKLPNGEILSRAAQINFMLGAVNLIPLSFLDGGRALKCVLSIKKARPISPIWTRRADMIIILMLFSAAIILSVKKYDVSFLIIFSIYCAITAMGSKT